PRLCLKYLNRYFKVPVSSKFDIVSQAMNVASCLKENTVDIVEEKLNEYLDSEHGYLTVDGFIAFRLQGLVDDIKALLNITVYENNLETEYNDFISFMKEIVSEQLPAYDEIFLLEDKNGFKILSDDGTDITLDYSGNDCKCCFFNSESELDSVLSSVIYIAPRRIYIHCSDEMFISSFCELIKGIFPGKVIKC
ncbi:MAG: hypothetical protein E7384_07035, partial [Ruminococcaceae bacterium]|nr:hypothetical protein [Oscillospiraceae bacterium]